MTALHGQPTEKDSTMNHADGWMGGSTGGAMWVWTVIGILAAAALVSVIGRLSTNSRAFAASRRKRVQTLEQNHDDLIAH